MIRNRVWLALSRWLEASFLRDGNLPWAFRMGDNIAHYERRRRRAHRRP